MYLGEQCDPNLLDTFVNTMEDIIFHILLHNLYPSRLLQLIFNVQLQYTNGEPLNTAQRRNLAQVESRHQARLDRVNDEQTKVESIHMNWPQPVPDSVKLSCTQSYREAIKYAPLDICASCGSEDWLRTGEYYTNDHLPCLDMLRIADRYILDHTPLSRFMYIDSTLEGLMLEP